MKKVMLSYHTEQSHLNTMHKINILCASKQQNLHAFKLPQSQRDETITLPTTTVKYIHTHKSACFVFNMY